MIKITQQEIVSFSKYVYDISGIHLDESKGYLLESRLNPLLTSYNLSGYHDLLRMAKSDSSKDLQEKIIDAVTTNETFFFRDKTPFTILQYKLIPELIDRRKKLYKSNNIPIRILSAACSTGQELYSIAITLLEEIPNINSYDISILGVDIADEVVAKASYGKYGKFEVERGMSPALLRKYFNPVENGWRIKDKVRVMGNFKKVNLLDTFSNIGYFDIIFCRNVAIYFKYNDKVKLFKRLARILEPDGALIVGGSESLSGVAPDFQVNHYLKGIYYTLNESSQEKTKEVKKFEVHAFNSQRTDTAPKKVKRIKRTIKYVEPRTESVPQKKVIVKNKLQQAQETLNRLKQKRQDMAQKSAVYNKSKQQIEENKSQETKTVEVPAASEKIENFSTQDVQTPQTLSAVLRNQKSSNSSLLGNIQTRGVVNKPLTYETQKTTNTGSLLSRITNK